MVLKSCPKSNKSPNLVTLGFIDPSSKAAMGSFLGHVVPGTFFILFSVWWSFSIFRRYFEVHFRNRWITTLSSVWPNLAKFRHFGKKIKFWQFFGKNLCLLGQINLSYWVNFLCCKLPNNEKKSSHPVTLLLTHARIDGSKTCDNIHKPYGVVGRPILPRLLR